MFNKTDMQLNLSTRMMILVGCLLSAMFVSNGIAIYKINTIGGYLVEIAEEDIPITNLLADITTKQVKQALELERAVRIALEYDQHHQKFAVAYDNFLMLSEDINLNIKNAESIAQKGEQYAHNAAAAIKFSDINLNLLEIETKHKLFDEHSIELLDNIRQFGFNSEIEERISDIEVEEEELIHELELLLHDLEDFTANTALEAEHLEQAALKLIVSIFALGAVIGLFVSITTFRSVARQMGGDPKCIMNFAKDISEGELRPNAGENTGKELSGVFNAMVHMRAGLAEVIDSIKRSAVAVQQGSVEIAQGNLNLSSRTEQQASNLEKTASNIKEMTGSVKQNADNAKQADELVKTARYRAECGGNVVGDAVSAMNEINHSSAKIADITSVIDEIAFQTNLLALNAAVEAARAGEQGRGFAVVASEVRILAGRSATAAKEIKDLIQDSVIKVESGTELVNRSGKTLEEIVSSVEQVSDIVAQISTSCQEQSIGIDHVNNAIGLMDDLTQQNAALVEQVATSSETIGMQAKQLRKSVAFFKTIEIDDLNSNRFADDTSYPYLDGDVQQRVA